LEGEAKKTNSKVYLLHCLNQGNLDRPTQKRSKCHPKAVLTKGTSDAVGAGGVAIGLVA
jgi:hypothetical protein